MPRSTRKKPATSDVKVQCETQIEQTTKCRRSTRANSTSRARRTVQFERKPEDDHSLLADCPWLRERGIPEWTISAAIIALCLALFLACKHTQSRVSATFSSIPLPKRYYDWRYKTTPINISRTGFPIVDTTYVQPLTELDTARRRYVRILDFDWEKQKVHLRQLDELFKQSRNNQSTWDKVSTYIWDVSAHHALEDARRDFDRLHWEGWNEANKAICELCHWLIGNFDGARIHGTMHKARLGLEGTNQHDSSNPQRLVELPLGNFGPVLERLDSSIQAVVNQAYLEDRKLESLFANVKRIHSGYVWRPKWKGISSPFRPTTWRDVVMPLIEQTSFNDTAAQRYSKIDKVVEEWQRFENHLAHVSKDMKDMVQGLYQVRTGVRNMFDKRCKNHAVYMSISSQKSGETTYTLNDAPEVLQALQKVLQQSECKTISVACRFWG